MSAVIIFMRHGPKEDHISVCDRAWLISHKREDTLELFTKYWHLHDRNRIGLAGALGERVVRKSARALVVFCKAHKLSIGRIFTSPYLRTLQTAKIVQTFFPDAEIEHSELLAELNNGALTGFGYPLFSEEFPEFRERVEKEGYLNAVPPLGESHADMRRRVLEFTEEQRRRNVHSIVVTHVAFLDALDQLIYKRSDAEVVERLMNPERFPYCSSITCRVRNGVLVPF